METELDLSKVHPSEIATAILDAQKARKMDDENYHSRGFESCACNATARLARAYLDLLAQANEEEQ